MIKSLKALTVAFWHVCKQIPSFFVERLEAYADEIEHINELRGRGEYPTSITKFDGAVIAEDDNGKS